MAHSRTLDLATVGYFRGESLIEDPYPCYEYLRAHGRVTREPHHGVVAVTGYEEPSTVYPNTATFSCNSPTGPFPPRPFRQTGDDIAAFINPHRTEMPLSEHLVTFDPQSTPLIGVSRPFTPTRLAEKEAFTWRLVDTAHRRVLHHNGAS